MTKTTAGKTDSPGNEIASYRSALRELPSVEPGVYNEHAARTTWIPGIWINHEHDPNTVVELARYSDPGDSLVQPDLEYEIRLLNSGIPICMTVEAAQLLGACLLQAAATATWDLVDNAEFLAERPAQ